MASRLRWRLCERPRKHRELFVGSRTKVGKLEIAEMWGGDGMFRRHRRGSGTRLESWCRLVRVA